MLCKAFKNIIFLGGIIGIPGLAYADDMSQPSHVQEALWLGQNDRFDQAFEILGNASDVEQVGYHHRFAEARLLAWSQRYEEAELVYMALLEKEPTNPDLKVSYGYLQLFRGRLDVAENSFQSVLDQYPAYQDATDGLERVRQIRRDAN